MKIYRADKLNKEQKSCEEVMQSFTRNNYINVPRIRSFTFEATSFIVPYNKYCGIHET